MDIKPYLNQDYDQLKAKYLKLGQLFVDTQFPANSASIGKFRKPATKVEWKRPPDIVDDPQFFVDNANPDDIDQGSIGDCWFLAGAIAVANVPDYIRKVVPHEGQSFDKNNDDYCGIFHFRFWQFGQWYDVVVDDLLPMDSSKKRLLYCANTQVPNEMWCALLEKAYAKLSSCYEFLDGGVTQDSMIDLTGGCEEMFDLRAMAKKKEKNEEEEEDEAFVWNLLVKGFKLNSLATGSIYEDENESGESIRKNGLVAGHAYTITKVVEVKPTSQVYKLLNVLAANESVRLIRLRNPWGNEVEWKGAYSDSSKEWSRIDDKIKSDIGLVFEKEGDFWMTFQDFVQSFDSVTFVHLDMNAFSSSRSSDRVYKWKNANVESGWVNGLNAGGSRASEQFWTNPQFVVQLKDVDKYDNEANTTTLIVSLMQADSVKRRNENHGQFRQEPIQIRIYRIRDQEAAAAINTKQQKCKKFTEKDLKYVGSTGSYIPYRTVTKRFRLQEGAYVIIPSTFDKNTELKFYLRMFTQMSVHTDDYSTTKVNYLESEHFKLEPSAHCDILPWPIIINSEEEEEHEEDYLNDPAYEPYKLDDTPPNRINYEDYLTYPAMNLNESFDYLMKINSNNNNNNNNAPAYGWNI